MLWNSVMTRGIRCRGAEAAAAARSHLCLDEVGPSPPPRGAGEDRSVVVGGEMRRKLQGREEETRPAVADPAL